MDPSTVFQYCNNIALLGWIILLLSPLIKYAEDIIQKGIIPIILGIIYVYYIATSFGSTEGSFSSLQGVMQLFTDEKLVLAGWVHYLAFDLWLGCWERGDARRHGVHFLLLIPCFFLTFMFGPAGLLAYIIIRIIVTRKFKLYDNFSVSS